MGNCSLGLGTVQWGMRYGVANIAPRASAGEINAILRLAIKEGVCTLDTASLYGEAESILGRFDIGGFKVITKTPKFSGDFISERNRPRLIETFERSLAKLSLDAVYGLLIHDAGDLLLPGAEKIILDLECLKTWKKVSKIGVSVYNKDQLDAVLNVITPDIVQIPLSPLDQRFLRDGSLEEMVSRGIEIHVRSVFLQGLLLMPLDTIPKYFSPIMPTLVLWHELTNTHQRQLL